MNTECELLRGRPFIIGAGFADDAEMQEAWTIHRDALRAKWAEKYGPGTRCFAEWLFEIVPKFGERPTTEAWAKHEQRRENFLEHGIVHTNSVPAWQEDECEFLYRHGVIDSAEYQAVLDLERE